MQIAPEIGFGNNSQSIEVAVRTDVEAIGLLKGAVGVEAPKLTEVILEFERRVGE